MTPGLLVSTGDWSPRGLLDMIGLIGVRVQAWNNFQLPTNLPAIGDHGAESVQAGNAAIDEIDAAILELHALRVQLRAELRADDEARARRIDQLIARRNQMAAGRRAKDQVPEDTAAAAGGGRA